MLNFPFYLTTLLGFVLIVVIFKDLSCHSLFWVASNLTPRLLGGKFDFIFMNRLYLYDRFYILQIELLRQSSQATKKRNNEDSLLEDNIEKNWNWKMKF